MILFSQVKNKSIHQDIFKLKNIQKNEIVMRLSAKTQMKIA